MVPTFGIPLDATGRVFCNHCAQILASTSGSLSLATSPAIPRLYRVNAQPIPPADDILPRLSFPTAVRKRASKQSVSGTMLPPKKKARKATPQSAFDPMPPPAETQQLRQSHAYFPPQSAFVPSPVSPTETRHYNNKGECIAPELIVPLYITLAMVRPNIFVKSRLVLSMIV